MDTIQDERSDILKILVFSPNDSLAHDFYCRYYRVWAKNIQCVDAADSEEAVARLSVGCIDVLIIDARLSERDGLDFLTEVREKNYTVPCIFIGVSGNFEIARNAMRLGINRYIINDDEKHEQAYTNDECLVELCVAINNIHAKKNENYIERDIKRFDKHPYDRIGCDASISKVRHWISIYFKNCGNAFLDVFSSSKPIWISYSETLQCVLLFGNDNILKQAEAKCVNLCPESGYIGISPLMTNDKSLDEGMEYAYAALYQRYIGPAGHVTLYREESNSRVYEWVKETVTEYMKRGISSLYPLLTSIVGRFRSQQLSATHALAFWNELAGYIRMYYILNTSVHALAYMTLNEMLSRYSSIEDMFSKINTILTEVKLNTKTTEVYDLKFDALLKDIDENLMRNLNLNQLAKKYSMNVGYCNKLFRKTTGKTFKKYLIITRMERAYKYIISGEKDLNKLSIWCGYNNLYYFNRSFKEYYGISPKKLLQHSYVIHP